MATKAINTLTVKTAAQMAASDYFVGHDNADPAAFRGRLDELGAFLAGTGGFLAALSEELPIEFGTFTPTLGGSTGDPTSVTYTSQIGVYARIARLVYALTQVGTSARTGGTGNIRLKGLPFNVDATGPTVPMTARIHNIPWASGSAQQFITGRALGGGNSIAVDRNTSDAVIAEVTLASWPTAANASLIMSGVYITP